MVLNGSSDGGYLGSRFRSSGDSVRLDSVFDKSNHRQRAFRFSFGVRSTGQTRVKERSKLVKVWFNSV
ncbi:hypothetical protein HanIR_Chr02g0070811 [Helianthus annuus]|nr:hypothetical protein HanIR_Chr02g0070811 [Helianthus annuus]